MNRIFLIFSFLASASLVQAQGKTASPTATLEKTEVIKPETLQFNESEFDFGKIAQGRPVTHIFTFKNTGTEPIVLNNVHASCGCTTPEWSKDTIPAGTSSQITVGFNAAAEGTFIKPVSITYNGDQNKQLIIKGDVWKTPVTSAPENNIVNQFKKNQ